MKMSDTDKPTADEVKAISAQATGGIWHLGHYANPDARCNCRYLFGGDIMGAIAEICPSEPRDMDNPPEDEAVANGKLICALVNAYRRGTLVFT